MHPPAKFQKRYPHSVSQHANPLSTQEAQSVSVSLSTDLKLRAFPLSSPSSNVHTCIRSVRAPVLPSTL